MIIRKADFEHEKMVAFTDGFRAASAVQKRQAIIDYCHAHDDDYCFGECPLANIEGLCWEDGADIDRNYEILFGKSETEVNNPYWDRITAIANRQRSKGIKEYGRGVEDDTADINVRLDRIAEELIDTLMYLEHLRDGLNRIKEVVG